MSGIHEVILNDLDSREVELPELPKLRVCAVGNEVFFSIVQSNDVYGQYQADVISEVGVHLDDLRAALALITDGNA